MNIAPVILRVSWNIKQATKQATLHVGERSAQPDSDKAMFHDQ